MCQRFKAIHARHVVIDRDQVEALCLGKLQTLRAAFRHRHDKAMPRERTPDQPAKTFVVVDIQDVRRSRGGDRVEHQSPSISGTWMTDRNRPSWRIACAKLS